MILHIIKKDLRLLWPFVAGLTLLNALTQWMRYDLSVHGNPSGWVLFGPIAVISWVLLIAMLAYQDVIPGTRQDWLTRPIKRRDLLAAKVLFVIVLLHVPLFLMMAIEVLAAGYSPAEAVGAAFKRSVTIFLALSLPTFAIAAITRNLIEAALAAIVVSITAEIASAAFIGLADQSCATCGSSLDWVAWAVRVPVMVAAAGIVIALQYFKRGATAWARGVVLVAAVVFMAAGRLSWSSAFALQRAVTAAQSEPPAVAISLDRSRAAVPDREAPERAAIMTARARLVGEESARARTLQEQVISRTVPGATILLPVRIDGQRAGTVLWADRVEIRLLDAVGRVVYRGEGGELELRAGAPSAAQAFFIPEHVLSAYAGIELRAELDYWLTSLEQSAAATLSASGQGTRLATGEQCSARPLRDGSALNLSCLSIRRPPTCYTASIEGGSDLLVCAPSYIPNTLWGNLFARFDVNVPVTSSARGGSAALRIATYEPRHHFTAQTVVPQLRLADWLVQAPR